MLRCLFIAAAILLVSVSVAADTLLWDNGDPDWRNWIGATTYPEGSPEGETPFSYYSDLADDFTNEAPWVLTRITIRGLFGWQEAGKHDPDQVQKSESITLWIYRPDAKGMPGALFWSKTLEGEAAQACQTLSGVGYVSGPGLFRDQDAGAGGSGKPLLIEVEDPGGLVTLPPGRWLLAWRVLRSKWEGHPEGGFGFCSLTSAFPRAHFEEDRSYCATGLAYYMLEERGGKPLPWSRPGPAWLGNYNLSFKLYGEKR